MLNLRFLNWKPQDGMEDEKPFTGGKGLLYRTTGPHGNGNTTRGGNGGVELGSSGRIRGAAWGIAEGVARR